MGRQNGQTSLEERTIIIDHHRQGKSLREIAKCVNRSHSTVQDIIKRFKERKVLVNKPKESSRKMFSKRDERWLLNEVKKNPKLSAPKLTLEAEKCLGKTCNPETVRNVLRKHYYNGRVARKKPFISEVNRKKRVEFAKEHQNKNFEFWKTVLFTDESKINLFGSDGRTYVWRKPNTELQEKNLRPSMKHGGGSVMIWGCMSANGVGNLEFIENIMDQTVYLNILKKNVQPSVQKLGIGSTFKFYQDNDLKHKALKVRNWLLYNCPKVLETPPQSPDINVIEHLWSELKVKVQQHSIKNKNDLKKAISEEWNKIPVSYCEKLVKSIPRRLREIIKSKGFPTKY